MNSLVIKNALLCDHRQTIKSDLRIDRGKIVDISPSLKDEHILDASNLIVMPACIDLNIQIKNHSHSNLLSIQDKAQRGGVGTIVLDSLPDQVETLKFFNTQSHITFISSAIPFTLETIQNLSTMHHDGASSISIQSSTPNDALKCIYEYAQFLNLSCLCSLNHSFGGVSAQSPMSFKMGLSQIPPFVEELEFSKFFCLANHFRVPTLIRALSEKNLFLQTKTTPWIQSEISIHHLLLNEEKIAHYDPWAKLTPPLMTKEIQDCFHQELIHINMLTSLHREFSTSSKEQTFEDASSGVDCLEFYFSLLFTELVKTNLLSLQELSAKTSHNQAQFLHLNQGEISIGYDANLIIFDPQESFEISHPLYGKKTLFGKIKAILSPKTGLHKVN